MVVVECFWKLEDGQKIAWQAKYVFDIDGVIAEADRSYSNALKSHATMFYIGKEKYENAEVGEKIRITPC